MTTDTIKLAQAIRGHAAKHPKEIWLKWKDGGYTYADVLASSQRAANGLLALGVKPGERVAIMMGNRPEFLWVHYGINFIGAHSVPINTSQRGATLQHTPIFKSPTFKSAALKLSSTVCGRWMTQT